MKTQHISGAEAIESLSQDLDMLMKGEWVPDDDSIEASIEMLEHIDAEREELLAALEGALTAVEYYHEHEGCDVTLHAVRRALRLATGKGDENLRL